MILFVADDHFGAHPGRNAFEEISADYPHMKFYENDWRILNRFDLANECDLLIFNMIASTCGQSAPDASAADAVRGYCERGKPLLLLHGASAALWPYGWFRRIVGLRWVRSGDPDGVEASFHTVEPYKVIVSKTRHVLADKLVPMDLSADEIYAGLEQTCPLWILMETRVNGVTLPQCTESSTPWGGRVVNFLPGHAVAVTRHASYIANLKTLIDDLLGGSSRQVSASLVS